MIMTTSLEQLQIHAKITRDPQDKAYVDWVFSIKSHNVTCGENS